MRSLLRLGTVAACLTACSAGSPHAWQPVRPTARMPACPPESLYPTGSSRYATQPPGPAARAVCSSLRAARPWPCWCAWWSSPGKRSDWHGGWPV